MYDILALVDSPPSEALFGAALEAMKNPPGPVKLVLQGVCYLKGAWLSMTQKLQQVVWNRVLNVIRQFSNMCWSHLMAHCPGPGKMPYYLFLVGLCPSRPVQKVDRETSEMI